MFRFSLFWRQIGPIVHTHTSQTAKMSEHFYLIFFIVCDKLIEKDWHTPGAIRSEETTNLGDVLLD